MHWMNCWSGSLRASSLKSPMCYNRPRSNHKLQILHVVLTLWCSSWTQECPILTTSWVCSPTFSPNSSMLQWARLKYCLVTKPLSKLIAHSPLVHALALLLELLLSLPVWATTAQLLEDKLIPLLAHTCSYLNAPGMVQLALELPKMEVLQPVVLEPLSSHVLPIKVDRLLFPPLVPHSAHGTLMI
jgi:hypothetical protein